MDKTSIIIIGTGVAGLFCALNSPKEREILLCTKEALDRSDSSLAQGGMCVLRGEEDYQDFFNDTLKAGHEENNKKAVDRMIRRSREILEDLLSYGVEFEKEGKEFLYTKEGAHSKARILYHGDSTGKEITDKLIKEAKKRKNISFLDNTTLIDLLVKENSCQGVIIQEEGKSPRPVLADHVVLATGGLGGLYTQSTNHPHLTGDGIALALKYGVAVKNLNYIQIHPTTLYSKLPGRRFLISESVRGEGGFLLNKGKERFVDELLPRDLLTQKIHAQMAKDEEEYVWLSMAHLGEEYIKKRFPNIYGHCLNEGYDVTKESIPVVPAQHYLMGGIQVNLQGRTSMENLYAIGETSNTGVHGANRLASNSLLESLVFAKEAAEDIGKEKKAESKGSNEKEDGLKSWGNGWANVLEDNEYYIKELDENKRIEENKRRILDEIERENQMSHVIMTSPEIDKLIEQALREDISAEDITTNAIVKGWEKGEVQLIAKEDSLLAGLSVFYQVFRFLDPDILMETNAKDGDLLLNGEVVAVLRGDLRALLSGERTALNFLQRMSGIATLTRRCIEELEGTKAQLVDTRKTTPNMRIFEKYAVKVGGGGNHRYNLSDGVLIKDNHIKAAGSIGEAIRAVRKDASFVRRIEVEVENLAMVQEALDENADIIMLDNMGIEEMKAAIKMIDGKALIECSGNVNKSRLKELSTIGVDFISCGALTHSSGIIDFSLKNLKVID